MRVVLGPCAVQLDGDGLDDTQIPAPRALTNQAGLADRGDEGCRAAVHDRGLVRVDLDDDVVHTHGIKRRHQVLDRRHMGAARITYDGRKVHQRCVRRQRLDLMQQIVTIEQMENNAGVGFGGQKRKSYRQAGVDTHPLEIDPRPNRLLEH